MLPATCWLETKPLKRGARQKAVQPKEEKAEEVPAPSEPAMLDLSNPAAKHPPKAKQTPKSVPPKTTVKQLAPKVMSPAVDGDTTPIIMAQEESSQVTAKVPTGKGARSVVRRASGYADEA